MKGLTHLPTEQQLLSAYHQLYFSKSISIKDLCLWSQWTRFDPRLGEILVDYFSKNWKKTPPLILNQKILDSCWPMCLAVLLEFTKEMISDSETSFFNTWMSLVIHGIEPKRGELYFIGLDKIAGKLMLKDATYPIKPYTNWGFLAREKLLPKSHRFKEKTWLTPKQREQLLQNLFKEKTRITVKNYREFSEHLISQRQAQRDLENHPQLIKKGNTKNRFYVIRKK